MGGLQFRRRQTGGEPHPINFQTFGGLVDIFGRHYFNQFGELFKSGPRKGDGRRRCVQLWRVQAWNFFVGISKMIDVNGSPPSLPFLR